MINVLLCDVRSEKLILENIYEFMIAGDCSILQLNVNTKHKQCSECILAAIMISFVLRRKADKIDKDQSMLQPIPS